jgi:hypothetical protein
MPDTRPVRGERAETFAGRAPCSLMFEGWVVTAAGAPRLEDDLGSAATTAGRRPWTPRPWGRQGFGTSPDHPLCRSEKEPPTG